MKEWEDTTKLKAVDIMWWEVVGGGARSAVGAKYKRGHMQKIEVLSVLCLLRPRGELESFELTCAEYRLGSQAAQLANALYNADGGEIGTNKTPSTTQQTQRASKQRRDAPGAEESRLQPKKQRSGGGGGEGPGAAEARSASGWTDHETNKLKQLIYKHGASDWEAKATTLGTSRSHNAVYQKYHSLTKHGWDGSSCVSDPPCTHLVVWAMQE